MSPSARTAATLATLVVLLVGGVAWGFSAMTEPFPQSEDPPLCEEKEVTAGSMLNPTEVTVSVLNASNREGLAGRTMSLLVEEGFVRGGVGNVPGDVRVRRAEIHTTDRDSPAVQLLRSWVGSKVKIVEDPNAGPAIEVWVGDRFSDDLRKGARNVAVEEDAVVCGPSDPTATETPL
ncbi:LytR C-terminal domain-containing protein [Nocardioides sp. SYSU D00038]|uniref:LytR C-terminal domain-containing protein n=1 Tax=Nocardioides sp. SYSU D00038 TaxID=2812554 RepID=UPI0019682620|nr:LytR C-terminal domain-containing protein [Nocardioides sp. SYSU D00038]